jgi:hypothetical protein
MPRNFNEKTTDRVVATADDRSTALIARTALRRVMTDSGSLYTKPYLLDWVQGKIDCFKDNLRREIVLKKGKLHRDKHFPELYAKMLREELEYIELCIEYNDKVGITAEEEGNFVEDDGPIAKKPNNEGYITNVNNEPKIVGKIDLNNIGDEIE